MLSETGSFISHIDNDSEHLYEKLKDDQNMKNKKYNKKKSSIMENAEKAKVANRKAQEIFISAINPVNILQKLKEDFKFISPEHLDDISEERTLSNICGYPLCMNEWHDNFGNRLFIIRRNRVYNIEQRKKFCCNKCFEAFEIVRLQIPKTPLFLRTYNDPEFCNLQINFPVVAKLTGKFGRLLDITDEDVLKNEVHSYEHVSSNINYEATSLMEDEEENVECSLAKSNDVDMAEVSKKTANSYINRDIIRQDGKSVLQRSENDNCAKTQRNINCDEMDPIQDAMKVEQHLKKMMSLETLRLILGETYLCDMLYHFSKCNSGDSSGMHLHLEARTRYIKLMQNIKEEETASVNESIGDTASINDAIKFEELVKETEKCSIKVKSFLIGDTEPEDFPKDSDREMENDISLPLIDKYSIMSWRRKIFFDKLNKYMPLHLNKMNLNEKKISDILKPIIFSLDLSPHNIYFTPSQWSLVCLSFLKLLSVRYEAVSESFQHNGRAHMEHVLSLFALDNLYLDRLLPYLTEIYYILEKLIPDSSKLNELCLSSDSDK